MGVRHIDYDEELFNSCIRANGHAAPMQEEIHSEVAFRDHVRIMQRELSELNLSELPEDIEETLTQGVNEIWRELRAEVDYDDSVEFDLRVAIETIHFAVFPDAGDEPPSQLGLELLMEGYIMAYNYFKHLADPEWPEMPQESAESTAGDIVTDWFIEYRSGLVRIYSDSDGEAPEVPEIDYRLAAQSTFEFEHDAAGNLLYVTETEPDYEGIAERRAQEQREEDEKYEAWAAAEHLHHERMMEFDPEYRRRFEAGDDRTELERLVDDMDSDFQAIEADRQDLLQQAEEIYAQHQADHEAELASSSDDDSDEDEGEFSE